MAGACSDASSATVNSQIGHINDGELPTRDNISGASGPSRKLNLGNQPQSRLDKVMGSLGG